MGKETCLTATAARLGLHRARMNAYTQYMINFSTGGWPDKPLIRIGYGYESGVGIVTGALAIRDAADCYRLVGGGLLVPRTGDVIETWEEMEAVPVHRASQVTAAPLRPAPPRSDETHVAGRSAL